MFTQIYCTEPFGLKCWEEHRFWLTCDWMNGHSSTHKNKQPAYKNIRKYFDKKCFSFKIRKHQPIAAPHVSMRINFTYQSAINYWTSIYIYIYIYIYNFIYLRCTVHDVYCTGLKWRRKRQKRQAFLVKNKIICGTFIAIALPVKVTIIQAYSYSLNISVSK
jgi:hypothetical protein